MKEMDPFVNYNYKNISKHIYWKTSRSKCTTFALINQNVHSIIISHT